MNFVFSSIYKGGNIHIYTVVVGKKKEIKLVQLGDKREKEKNLK